MFRSLLILYLIIFGCYILWTRQPDYFDGEFYPATVQIKKDSATKLLKPEAIYTIGGKTYRVDIRYVLLQYLEGEKVKVIVEMEHPERAKVYRFWGYWLTWGELVGSVILAILLFQVAVSITNNPTPEALLEQLNYKEEKKTKYD